MADTTKVELRLNAEQLRRLDALKAHVGLNTRTDAVRILIQERYMAIFGIDAERSKR